MLYQRGCAILSSSSHYTTTSSTTTSSSVGVMLAVMCIPACMHAHCMCIHTHPTTLHTSSTTTTSSSVGGMHVVLVVVLLLTLHASSDVHPCMYAYTHVCMHTTMPLVVVLLLVHAVPEMVCHPSPLVLTIIHMMVALHRMHAHCMCIPTHHTTLHTSSSTTSSSVGVMSTCALLLIRHHVGVPCTHVLLPTHAYMHTCMHAYMHACVGTPACQCMYALHHTWCARCYTTWGSPFLIMQ